MCALHFKTELISVSGERKASFRAGIIPTVSQAQGTKEGHLQFEQRL